ncbi:MAG: hypothetical protein MRY21_00535 [Simkaniaceae bacterium]|nr:hypothetical protein [Simkaniaceae bacterium]
MQGIGPKYDPVMGDAASPPPPFPGFNVIPKATVQDIQTQAQACVEQSTKLMNALNDFMVNGYSPGNVGKPLDANPNGVDYLNNLISCYGKDMMCWSNLMNDLMSNTVGDTAWGKYILQNDFTQFWSNQSDANGGSFGWTQNLLDFLSDQQSGLMGSDGKADGSTVLTQDDVNQLQKFATAVGAHGVDSNQQPYIPGLNYPENTNLLALVDKALGNS